MTKLHIYNTLTRKIEELIPIQKKKIKMYACGITVYDDAHIGHARQAIIFDVIRNYLESLDYEVTYVRNFTDIDDKIIARANSLNQSASKLSEHYIKETSKDLTNLKTAPATFEPKVTENIKKIICFIERLIEKGFAYESNGDVLFDITKFKDYGKLSNRKLDKSLTSEENSNKRNQQDFSLWKKAKQGEPYWDSPWGKGRPGWHIECSVLAYKYLGERLDIHGGGLDLVFPHHENEIAQSESFTGKKFANFWIHNGLVEINGKKMSKSSGNFITIKSVLKKYHPDIIRFAVLSHQYNSPINFSENLFENATKRVLYFYKTLSSVDELIKNKKISTKSNQLSETIDIMKNRFSKEMNNNFDTEGVIASFSETFSQINDFINHSNVRPEDRINALKIFKMEFLKIANVLNILNENPEKFLSLYKQNFLKHNNISEKYILAEISERSKEKLNKNFDKADRIREKLKEKRISLQDTSAGVTWDVIIDFD